MEDPDTLVLQVQPSLGDDDEELARLTQRLRANLLALDVASVDRGGNTSPPDEAKGFGTIIGWLAVRLGKEGLGSVVAAVVGWATRSGHNVEITWDGDTLKVSGVTSAQQDRIINDFLARHAPYALDVLLAADSADSVPAASKARTLNSVWQRTALRGRL
jgi:hypothetical protein